MKSAYIKAISYFVPSEVRTNSDIIKFKPDWTEDKIYNKTGIRQRFIASEIETASDLALEAANKLISEYKIDVKTIDCLLFCTQSPDYFLPTTACILQDKLNLPKSAFCLDYNLGCSGYVYGLSIINSLIKSGQISCALLLTGDTYSKYIVEEDVHLTSIFSDAGSATLVTEESCADDGISLGTVGTDGSGAKNLIVEKGGHRFKSDSEVMAKLFMNGPEIFTFTMKNVPNLVKSTLEKNLLALDDVDYYVFHQANAFMLEHLRKKIGIPREKFFVCLENFGNTVSSTIPIALNFLAKKNSAEKLKKVMLVGFGVGYSWSANIVDLSLLFYPEC